MNNRYTILKSINKMAANSLCLANKINVPQILNLNKKEKDKFF